MQQYLGFNNSGLNFPRIVNQVIVVVELVSKELNHLAAILHVYAKGLNFMK